MKQFLRTLLCTAILGTVAAAAQAQARVYAGVRAPFRPAMVAAMPACPGVGYVWTPGYYAGALWYPGRWIYRGGYVGGGYIGGGYVGSGYGGGGYYGRGYYGRYDHRDRDHYRAYDRHDDRAYNRGYDRDHDRGGYRR
ncbi:MAG TPA: hypothetical protein VHX60_12300 [Acidobacteriaceae bacterium]|jgi:hypothetical protein|nr:hypothetical protein [Acidobacteriaceae bacterium]